jgi:hypothetical protein
MILLFSTIIFKTTSSYAQATETPKTRFSVLGGINFQNLNGKDIAGDKLENKMIIGFHGGFNVMIPLVPEFYLQPGLMFSTKGGKQKEDSFTNTVRISYLEMPLNFVYRATLGKGFIMLGFGPYIAFGLNGSRTMETNSGTTKTDIKFQNTVIPTDSRDVTYAKRFDSGANIFVGYEMSGGIFLQLNTQLGMLKINPSYSHISADKTVIKNTGFGMSVGYRF